MLCCGTGCGPRREAAPTDKLYVLSTTGMLYDAVLNIARDSVEAQALMGAGVDPHVYKVSHGDVEELQRADLILYNGLHLEGKMGEVLEGQARVKSVLAVAEALPREKLLAVGQGVYDPHVWFDVGLWQEVVKEISWALQEHDKRNRDFYIANTEAYLRDLQSLDVWVRDTLSGIPESQRVLLTAHDAFGYFGRAYDIEVLGVQGISTQSDVGLRDITDLVDLVLERKLSAIFAETSVSDRSIRAIVEGCREQGHVLHIGKSLYSDAMGAFGTEEGTYKGMVRANVRHITEALAPAP